jgi:Glycosyl hydrolase family 79 C-terminal beta domain
VRLTAGAGHRVPAGFLGLSFEFSAVPSYAGLNPTAVNPVLVQLIRNFTPGGGFVLRIGGDSTDQSWWPTAGQSAPPGVTYALAPDWLATVRSLLAATDGRAVLGVNLKAGRPQLAAAEAQAFLSGLGRDRILGLEIGNEPEQYRSHSRPPAGAARARSRRARYRAFVQRFSRWRKALPDVPLVGPATGSLGWLSHLGQFLSAEPTVSQVSVHRYGLSDCITDPGLPRYPTVANLLSPTTARRMVHGLAPYVAMAHGAGATFRIDEVNSVTCQGQGGVSDTFASALWMLETLFEEASIGVDGVNVHVWPGAGPNQLFTFDQAGGGWLGSVRPAYYALLMFNQAAPPGSRLLPTQATGAGPISSWAALAPDGSTRVALVNSGLDGTQATTVRVGPGTCPATVIRMQAPSAYATDGVTLAGQSFATPTTTGRLEGSPVTESVQPSAGGGYQVALPAASAAVLEVPPGC